jgi:hypothetical protein
MHPFPVPTDLGPGGIELLLHIGMEPGPQGQTADVEGLHHLFHLERRSTGCENVSKTARVDIDPLIQHHAMPERDTIGQKQAFLIYPIAQAMIS